MFLFGFAGMGQLYRTILQEYAESTSINLSVFIQTPPLSKNELSAFGKDSGNSLLSEWAEFGNENLQLWGKPEFLTEKPFAEDSLLAQVQASFATEKNVPHLETFDTSENTLTLTSAPSKLREIEGVHSKICALLAEKSSDKAEQTQLGDILVLAPKIQDYKVAIEQVFTQETFYEKNEFPNLPYVIADSSAESSLTAQALEVLFSILQKGYVCRADVFSLLRNPLVQEVRNILPEQVDSWSSWATEMHIYRDRGGTGKNPGESEIIADWKNAEKRLLLSRLTDELYSADGNEFLPYQTIETQDDKALCKFIAVIDELEEWCALGSKEAFTDTDIINIEESLNRWLLLGNYPPKNLAGENLIFKSIMQEIKNQKIIAENGVFRDCFLYALLDAAKATSMHSSAILSRGITFADFKPNRILGAKYVFLLGFDSKAFPGVDSENELDLRLTQSAQKEKGDDSIPAHNKNAFLCQLMAAEKGLFISYVNKNLQKDEDFYRSSLAQKLFGAIYWTKDEKGKIKEVDYETKLHIDETRTWNELFTPRAFRNKKNYLQLQNNWTDEDEKLWSSLFWRQKDISADSKSSDQKPSHIPDSVSISQIRKFLRDPFQYMAESVFTGEDDASEEERTEFEAICFNNLISSELKKNFVHDTLEKTSREQELKENLKNKNLLPDGVFGELGFAAINEDAKRLSEKIADIGISDFVYENTEDVFINQTTATDEGDKEKQWILRGNRAWYNKDFMSAKKICTVEIGRDCLSGYVTALSLLASLSENNKDEFELALYSLKMEDGVAKSKKTELPDSHKMTRATAVGILNEIYKAMFVEKYKTCVPYSLIVEDSEKIKNLSDLEEKLTGMNGKWEYFSKKNLFDIYSDIGYTETDFKTQWALALGHQYDLLKFLEKPDFVKNAQEAQVRTKLEMKTNE